MKTSAIKNAFQSWMWWRKCPATDSSFEGDLDESPIRAELYNVDQLERHAKAVATTHTLAKGRIADQLLPRLTENEQVLVNAYDLISAAAEKNRRIASAAEWLLDNFYLIEEQIRSTRRLLPKSYSGELPRLLDGPSANYPRVYGIALELIGHTDGRVDASSLNGFISAYHRWCRSSLASYGHCR